MKNFVVAMDSKGNGFQYLKDRFGETKMDAKLKAVFFVRPEIRQIMCYDTFRSKLKKLELPAWDAFVLVVQNFPFNNRAENDAELVSNMLAEYQELGCRMQLKMYFLHSHLDFLPPNLGDVSDENGERFHQYIVTMETRYQGHFKPNMMGDYCWFLQQTLTSTKASA